MTRKTAARNTEAQATIALDGIRTAAREIRTMFPNTQRPALNTLMNTMTRELGLGQSYGHALSSATQQPGAEPAIPAHRTVTFEIHFTAPDWVRHLATVSSEVTSSLGRETFRGKPVHILNVHRLAMTGAMTDADAAAKAFVDAHPLFQRSDVKIRKINVTDSSSIFYTRHYSPDPRRPEPIRFDPNFPQDLPAGLWTIAGTLYYEIAPGPAVKSLRKRLKKIGLQDRDNVFGYSGGVRYYIPGLDQPAIVAIPVRHAEICQNPIARFTQLDPSLDERRDIATQLTPANREALKNATLIGRVVFSLGVIPITFRLYPNRIVNGRTVPDNTRPTLLADVGAAFPGLKLGDFAHKKRTPEMNAKILELAGARVDETGGYRIVINTDLPGGETDAIAL